MQEFDYSNETSNDLYDAVDGLSYEEAVFAKEAIETAANSLRIGKRASLNHFLNFMTFFSSFSSFIFSIASLANTASS